MLGTLNQDISSLRQYLIQGNQGSLYSLTASQEQRPLPPLISMVPSLLELSTRNSIHSVNTCHQRELGTLIGTTSKSFPEKTALKNEQEDLTVLWRWEHASKWQQARSRGKRRSASAFLERTMNHKKESIKVGGARSLRIL